MNPRMSVIVPTKDRPEKLDKCLKSILDNNFSNYEIIVVDQSKQVNKSRYKRNVRYIRINRIGLCNARNFGVQNAKSGICVFTDDDCIVDKNWLRNIYMSLNENKNIGSVFGKVSPYKPNNNDKKICLSCTKINKTRIFNKPQSSKNFIFLGNSMAYRRKVFDEIGLFKEWLDVGSVGLMGGDEEFAYRYLKHNGTIIFNPKILSYHDHWLNKKEFVMKSRTYSCGFFAAFSYYAFRGDRLALTYLTRYMCKKFEAFKKKFIKLLLNLHFKSAIYFLAGFVLEQIKSYLDLWGMLVGIYFALYDLIFKKQNQPRTNIS